MTGTPTGGGLTAIRDALRNRKRHVGLIARDVGVAAAALDGFAHNQIETLPIDIVHAIVAEVWNGWVIYLQEEDLLTSKPQPEARSIGIRPTWKIDIPKHAAGACVRPGPQREIPVPKPRAKPGWLGVWE